MSFLLDTNICSAHMRRPAGLFHRFVQHSGRLAISIITLAELRVWAYGSANPPKVTAEIEKLLMDVSIIEFDSNCADRFGQLKAGLLKGGIAVPPMDLLIATTALAQDLTLVTHNVADFANIPDLRVVDWLES